jgi:ABC-type nickel/cobalt efflux system permease component RcnA
VKFMVVAVIIGMVGAFAGGYVSTVIDRRAGLFVAVIIALVAIASLIASRGASPWTQVAALVLLAPSAMLGFWKRRRSTRAASLSP